MAVLPLTSHEAQRRAVRYSADHLLARISDPRTQAQATSVDHAPGSPVTLIDISEAGASFIYPQKLARGQIIHIDILGEQTQARRISAEVRNVQALTPKIVRVGVAFTLGEDDVTRHHLNGLIQYASLKGISKANW
ncbi:PilZ domain-containing protein [Hydrocarboniclastica marina]|uniref:PilZ domain-containing protein n=1 Tax=Hydrocarboniclastica marina TaxID=2259620 RepID=A0A4V1D9B6_9ALTE|nr:PilZ domain-containing protein [Hydrocarboniclastica marina]